MEVLKKIKNIVLGTAFAAYLALGLGGTAQAAETQPIEPNPITSVSPKDQDEEQGTEKPFEPSGSVTLETHINPDEGSKVRLFGFYKPCEYLNIPFLQEMSTEEGTGDVVSNYLQLRPTFKTEGMPFGIQAMVESGTAFEDRVRLGIDKFIKHDYGCIDLRLHPFSTQEEKDLRADIFAAFNLFDGVKLGTLVSYKHDLENNEPKNLYWEATITKKLTDRLAAGLGVRYNDNMIADEQKTTLYIVLQGKF
ncbi:hypothetical protein KY331_05490 [Candidatus Woesearchaeota archaeon]|nr:hypothetical protein [Candidatus Woesearchaeota archaeon]